MKRIYILCCFVLCLVLFIGCETNSAQTSSGETAPVASAPDIVNVTQASAADLKRPDVTISGMTFTVNGKTYDISKLDRSANAIVLCDYITDTVIILECHISPRASFYALFNIETKDYENSFYGTNCTWKENDLSSVIYAFENTVCDAAGQTIYTVDITESQYINNLELSPDGKTVTVRVCDNNSESDIKTYKFER